MNDGIRWSILVGVIFLSGIVGVMAFNAGVARGVEQAGKVVVAAPAAGPAAGPVVAYPYPYGYPYYYGWHSWGGFFLLFIVFSMFVRGLFGRGWGYRRGYGYGCGAGGAMDEWHRHAHERMWNGGEPGAEPKP